MSRIFPTGDSGQYLLEEVFPALEQISSLDVTCVSSKRFLNFVYFQPYIDRKSCLVAVA